MFIDKKTLNIIKCKPQTLLGLLCKNPKIRVSEIRVSACLLFSVIALCLFFYLSLSRSHGFSLNLSTEFLFQIQAATIGDLVSIFWREGEGIWRMQICSQRGRGWGCGLRSCSLSRKRGDFFFFRICKSFWIFSNPPVLVFRQVNVEAFLCVRVCVLLVLPNLSASGNPELVFRLQFF